MNGLGPHGENARATPAAWNDFERAAPELAEAVRSRFEAHLHHIIGTVRQDGSPRLSGTEVRIEHGELTIGMMMGSQKLSDVQRDPRVEIHSAPLDTELAAGDAKLSGSLVEQGLPHEAPGTSFRLRIALASLVRVEGNELVLMTWRPGRGLREIRRS
ncbi:MAG: pyridoxamine 5'-phosphate oxidase family protein [Actinomycetota bacterium]|nr:pyridoxamine 5'-phosphate oxidase family protein [Actinomycetota bacterium]